MVNHGAPSLLVQLVQTSTIAAGAVTFEGTYDGTFTDGVAGAAISILASQIVNPATFATLTNPYTLVASTNQPFLILSQGFRSIRIKLSTAITGSATVTPYVTLLNYNPAIGALLNPLAAGSAIIGKVGVDQTTPGTTNGVAVVGVNGATALAGNGATGTGSLRVTAANDNTGIANWGHGATAASVPSGATFGGCAGRSAEQTAVTNGQLSGLNCDLAGRLVTQPYSVKELMVRGSGSATDTSATTVLAAGSGSNKTYVTDWMCSNTSATAARVTFNDSASTTVIVPAGSGNNKNLSIPLVTAAATALTFTASTGVSTIYCSATGYYGL
jgi:hypothetical protein